MKKLKLIILFASIGAVFTLSNCGNDNPAVESVTDQQLAKLSKTWKLTAVTLTDGIRTNSMATSYKTSGVDQFTLTISGTKGASSYAYSTTKNPTTSVWKGSSDWKLGSDPLTIITRDIATPVNMTYTLNGTGTSATLVLTFDFSGTGYDNQGRTEATAGKWVFTFGQ